MQILILGFASRRRSPDEKNHDARFGRDNLFRRDRQVVRRGEVYRDPDDNDVIGYEVLPVGDAEVRVFGGTRFLRDAADAVFGPDASPLRVAVSVYSPAGNPGRSAAQ